MHAMKAYSTSAALQHVFVLPTLHQTSRTAALSQCKAANQALSRSSPIPIRHLSGTAPRLRIRRSAPRPPPGPINPNDAINNTVNPLRRNPINDDIPSRIIYLVNPATGRFSEDGPVTTWDTLRDLDTNTHRLAQVGTAPSTDRRTGATIKIPVCRIENLEEIRAAERARRQAAKEAKKNDGGAAKGGVVVTKTLELNWAIDGNDLAHRLVRMQDFLAAGRRVEIMFAPKKKGRRATGEECEAVLDRVREAVAEVRGAKERKALDGKIGGVATMVFDGAIIRESSSEQQKGKVVNAAEAQGNGETQGTHPTTEESAATDALEQLSG